MVFDQLLNMYRHVKNYGIDRTFLSLYNSNGQLNKMIGYRFPSCESIDSVGNVNSSASRAFIAAMEYLMVSSVRSGHGSRRLLLRYITSSSRLWTGSVKRVVTLICV